jgi:competence protein ComEC
MAKSGPKRLMQMALLSILIVIISVATVTANENLTVHFVDVSQGDSILLQFQGKNVLIDGGIEEMGPRVESYLRDNGVSNLTLLVATHPHEDHIGGMITILNDIPVKQILDSGQTHTAPSFETYLKLIDQKNIRFDTAQKGQTINLDPNIEIEVLSPPATLFSDDLNQNSIVLKVTCNKVSFLLMGYAGFEAENSLLFKSGYDLKSDILKVAHHGSSSASSPAFLSAVKPAISIIEVGAGNDYGHLTKKTLSALQSTGSKVYRTDLDGNIVVTTDGQSYSISTEKQPKRTVGRVRQTTAASFAGSVAPVAAISAVAAQFVGSSRSDKYHYPGCPWAQKINPGNLISFSGPQDARTHGYVPCGVCHPP